MTCVSVVFSNRALKVSLWRAINGGGNSPVCSGVKMVPYWPGTQLDGAHGQHWKFNLEIRDVLLLLCIPLYLEIPFRLLMCVVYVLCVCIYIYTHIVAFSQPIKVTSLKRPDSPSLSLQYLSNILIKSILWYVSLF